MTLPFQTKCPCGSTISAGIKKPTQMEPGIAKISCATCKSRFLIKCIAMPGKSQRDYKIDFNIIELSEIAKQNLQDKIDKRIPREESYGEN